MTKKQIALKLEPKTIEELELLKQELGLSRTELIQLGIIFLKQNIWVVKEFLRISEIKQQENKLNPSISKQEADIYVQMIKHLAGLAKNSNGKALKLEWI